MPSTYGKTSWRGGHACGCMIQSIEKVVEPRLRAAGILGENEKVYGIQYAYRGDVDASGGTHDQGGALDHAKGSDAETKIWRECGWADWQRGSPEDSSFEDHNHGIVIGCPHLSDAAADQVYDYKNGRNGLASGNPDQSPYVPYITWQEAYDKYVEDDVRHVFLYLSTSDKMGSKSKGSFIPFDEEQSDEAGFHTGDDAQIRAPWNSVGTYMFEGSGDARVSFQKFNAENEQVGEIGLSEPGGDLTIVQDLPKGYRLRVIVKEGSCPDARLKADIRER